MPDWLAVLEFFVSITASSNEEDLSLFKRRALK